MSISKKYVKGIMSGFNIKEIPLVLKELEEISKAFGVDKFNKIISSPLVSLKQKEDLILGMYEGDNQKFINLLKILVENGRIDSIPEIKDEIKNNLVAMKNEYIGQVYSKDEISKDDLAKLESNFSKKFNAKINLEYIKSDLDGIKIDIKDLGVEINFSMDRLKSKLTEYILQAI